MKELTPMLKQYFEIKDRHPNDLLMFRLGDFYEMFGEDAKEASQILNIVLTARSKGTPNEIAMCGIPHHALNNYLPKLLKANKRVAICDQVSDPSLPGIVQRAVTRVITPGTTLDENTLEQKNNNYIISLSLYKNIWGVAIADLTTGEFKIAEFNDLNLLKNEIFRLNVSEVVVAKGLFENKDYQKFISGLPNVSLFQLPVYDKAEKIILNHFKVKNLNSFGVQDSKVAIESAGILLGYFRETQKTALHHITKIQRYNLADFMVLDEATIRNLELFFVGATGEYNGSLLSVIDRTITSMGGRLLRQWLMLPLLNVEKINLRLNAVGEFKLNSILAKNLILKLKEVADIERLMARIGCNRTNARDLVALRQTLLLLPEIKQILSETKSELLKNIFDKLSLHQDLKQLLEETICDEPPAVINEGNMIKDGYNHELDELRQIARGGKDWLAKFQSAEIEKTKINSLKVKYNRVFGYYIEISKANLTEVPADYTRKQTLVNAERFSTPELKEYEEKILTAEEKIAYLEQQIFSEIVEKVMKYFDDLQKTAKFLAKLDVLINFSQIATENNYTKPIVTENNLISIKSGRHPVIEKMVMDRFVPNDLFLDRKQDFILLTGPNMSGKSSFLRQSALIVLLAQIGCFVPASQADIGLVDRIFTRVGAGDNLTQGVSTFMAEMQEAANILNNATDKSLIILDELGRGTSTYDGVSIAWSIIEYLHDKIKAKTIFATHYHELTEIVEKLERGANYCVAVTENDGNIVFLHQIIKGSASESYGIEVAKLAGLPDEIIFKSTEILKGLEAKSNIKQDPVAKQTSLNFPDYSKEKKLRQELKTLDPNNLTPIEALEKLAKIKKDLM